MSQDPTELQDERCEWCGGLIPASGDACLGCGAARPRPDAILPGLVDQQQSAPVATADPVSQDDELDERARARQILIDMDAYIDEPDTSKTAKPASDPSDDALIIIGVLAIAGILGALGGWMVAPPFIHDLFESQLGIEAEGPESFRRLGAFMGALVSMLLGAVLGTVIRR